MAGLVPAIRRASETAGRHGRDSAFGRSGHDG